MKRQIFSINVRLSEFKKKAVRKMSQKEFNDAVRINDLSTVKRLYFKIDPSYRNYDNKITFGKLPFNMEDHCFDNDFAELYKFYLESVMKHMYGKKLEWANVWEHDFSKCPNITAMLLDSRFLWRDEQNYRTFKDRMEENSFALLKRLEDMEKKLEMLWYSPGMPGAEFAKQHFIDEAKN